MASVGISNTGAARTRELTGKRSKTPIRLVSLIKTEEHSMSALLVTARMAELSKQIVGKFEILAGNEVGPSGASWQDIAGSAASDLQELGLILQDARAGHHGPAIVFPSFHGE